MRFEIGRPHNARKDHLFKETEIVSLCGKWMYGGSRELPDDWEPDNNTCQMCLKAADRL